MPSSGIWQLTTRQIVFRVVLFQQNCDEICVLLTCLDACKGESELSNEVVPGCLVIVFHHKANQSQLRGVDDKM